MVPSMWGSVSYYLGPTVYGPGLIRAGGCEANDLPLSG